MAERKNGTKISKRAPTKRRTAVARRSVAPTATQSFILGQPRTMTANDVVSAGEKEGLKFSAAYVYAVRKERTQPAPAIKQVRKEQSQRRESNSLSATMRQVIVDHGLLAVEAEIAKVRQMFNQV